MEDIFWQNMTFYKRWPSIEDTFHEKFPVIEDNLQWKTTIDIGWNTNFDGREPLMKDEQNKSRIRIPREQDLVPEVGREQEVQNGADENLEHRATPGSKRWGEKNLNRSKILKFLEPVSAPTTGRGYDVGWQSTLPEVDTDSRDVVNLRGDKEEQVIPAGQAEDLRVEDEPGMSGDKMRLATPSISKGGN